MSHHTTNTTTTGKESTVDKIKDALHIGHGHSNGSTTHTTGTTGHSTVGTTGHSTVGNGVPEGTAGPHSSRLANAADPRVDSDLDSSRHTGTHTGTGLTGTTGTHTGGGLTGTGAGYSTTGTTGTHTGTHAGNHHIGGTGTTGGISNSTNAGPHNSNIANKLDPRVDSDLSNTGNRHGANTGASAGVFGAHGSHATPGSGTAQNTAGPHNSDTLNKLDPRVDADLDGSKTIGGNRTHA